MSDLETADTVTQRSIDADAARIDAPPPTSPIDQVRRFVSRWNCDREFREELFVDPKNATSKRGLSADPEQLRIFWDADFRAELEHLPHSEISRKISPLGLVWLEFGRRNKEYRDRIREESSPTSPRFAAWRRRQIGRCELTFRPAHAADVPHIPFAIEPSKGCSVGCWFCGVSAPKLKGHFSYQGENVESFRRLMHTFMLLVGREAGKWGILYWATDPFDHPDYEQLCSDFEKSFGRFPVTTTAQGWKDLPRLRQLLRLAGPGISRIRLSILNLKVLDRYLAELTPRELATVSFVPVNKDSAYRPVDSGRARRARPTAWGSAEALNDRDTSIACVTGFLINLVDKTVRLISPCAASDKWPDGLFVYDEKQYQGIEDLRSVLDDMIERHMPLTLPTDRPLSFNSDLIYSRNSNGFRLSSRMNSREFGGGSRVGQIGDLIHVGKLAMSQIITEMEGRHDVPRSASLAFLEDLFSAGVIASEPR